MLTEHAPGDVFGSGPRAGLRRKRRSRRGPRPGPRSLQAMPGRGDGGPVRPPRFPRRTRGGQRGPLLSVINIGPVHTPEYTSVVRGVSRAALRRSASVELGVALPTGSRSCNTPSTCTATGWTGIEDNQRRQFEHLSARWPRSSAYYAACGGRPSSRNRTGRPRSSSAYSTVRSIRSITGLRKHEVASFLGSQFPGDATVGIGYKIFNFDSRIPYPAGPVLRSRGDSAAVWRPRHALDPPSMGADDNDLGAGFAVPDSDRSVA